MFFLAEKEKKKKKKRILFSVLKFEKFTTAVKNLLPVQTIVSAKVKNRSS